MLVVSKVANFAVDLPDASVAIEVSGSYGSRQEEAQRLGRLLRPKQGENRAYFYAVVSEDSQEEMFAIRRQLFLIEQGYAYHTVLAKPRVLLICAGFRGLLGSNYLVGRRLPGDDGPAEQRGTLQFRPASSEGAFGSPTHLAPICGTEL